jgi:putative drug exporter of the RND superfamily
MLDRIARACVRARGRVLLVWLAVVAATLGLGIAFSAPTSTQFSLPGTDSQRAADLMSAAGLTTDQRASAQLVLHTDDPAGLTAGSARAQVTALLTAIGTDVPGVTVTSPYAPDARGQIAADGRTAWAAVDLGSGTDDAIAARQTAVDTVVHEHAPAGITAALAGDGFSVSTPGGLAEGVGLLLALLILVIAFGSVIAAGLPLLVALAGVGVGAGIVFLAGHLVDMPSFGISLTAMLGIGVGIDYALLVVTRFRSGLDDGLGVEDAVARAMSTAGRSVLFAGATVTVAIFGMLAQGGSSGVSMVIASAAGVLCVMAAALTLLPAALGLVGRRVTKWHIGSRRSRRTSTTGGPAYRWSRFVQRHPWAMTGAALVTLAVLAIPAFSLRLGFSDAGNRPTTDQTRQAYDLLAQGWGPGANGPLEIVATLPAANDLPAVQAVGAAIAQTPGVAAVTPATAAGNGSVALLRVLPTTGPQDSATVDLVHHLRDTVVPTALAAQHVPGVQVYVAGATAGAVDYADHTVGVLPWMLIGVLGASFLLLALAFRSLVVPLKAIVVNLLSLGAAFGVLVAVFQWGWGSSLLGVGKTGPVEAWVPMMLFAIAYGLSMDYEVFLLSRVREEYLRSGDAGGAVADGLARTARVITAAAAIMVCVFASFVLMDDRGLKTMGLGLAAAVLIDATVVRMVLVPAVMQLLGRANWFWPTALRRVPRFDVDPAEPARRELVDA